MMISWWVVVFLPRAAAEKNGTLHCGTLLRDPYFIDH